MISVVTYALKAMLKKEGRISLDSMQLTENMGAGKLTEPLTKQYRTVVAEGC